MVQLLLQGLHNKDRKILDSVLDRADEELIENTVKKLPVEFVIPLIKELQHYIKVSSIVSMLVNHLSLYLIINTGEGLKQMLTLNKLFNCPIGPRSG